jgi:glycosyltransferase involved in cell wall biosynthesis
MVFTLPPFIKKALIRLDLFTMQLADLVILADDSRKQQIQADRLKHVIVFYNSPDDVYGSTKRFKTNHPPEGLKLNLIYVGLVDNRKRDFQFAMDVIGAHPSVGLDVYGAGRDYNAMARKYNDSNNIRFLGKVPYEQILNVEAEYDGVFAVYDPSIPNNVLASPNKLFEAMMLSKPVILNKEVVAAQLIEEFDIGYTYTFNDPVDFERVLDEMLRAPETAIEKGVNGRALYLSRFGFSEQRKQLSEAYASLAKE